MDTSARFGLAGVAIVTSTIAIGLTLTACGSALARSDQATPYSAPPTVAASGQDATTNPARTTWSARSPSCSRSPPRNPRPPREPLTYKLLVQQSGDNFSSAHPVDPDGTFALDLPPGTHQVTVLQVEAADLGEDPVNLPLHITRNLQLNVPETGMRLRRRGHRGVRSAARRHPE